MVKRVEIMLSDKLYKQLSKIARQRYLTLNTLIVNLLSEQILSSSKEPAEFEDAFSG